MINQGNAKPSELLSKENALANYDLTAKAIAINQNKNKGNLFNKQQLDRMENSRKNTKDYEDKNKQMHANFFKTVANLIKGKDDMIYRMSTNIVFVPYLLRKALEFYYHLGGEPLARKKVI